MLAFTLHVFVLLLYWASPLILSFQVLILLLTTIAWMMMTVMTIWDTVPTLRSVRTSIAIRCGHHFILSCFERVWEDLSKYGFWETLYTLPSVCDTLHEIFLFWAPACANSYILLILSFTVLCWKLSACCSSILKMVLNVYFSLQIKCLRKLIIEFSVTKNE